YRRKRMEGPSRPIDITSGVAAEAVLAVWRSKPHQAKFLTREHFGKLYSTIFAADLHGAQVVAAVLLYRIAENRRRRPAEQDPPLVRYASCFIAMQMGRRLLKGLNLDLARLDHRVFTTARTLIEEQGDAWFHESVADIQRALEGLYGSQTVSAQQLAATFRRGDLIERLRAIEV
ncbi:MAG: AIPR family protein, partial [Lamprocystis purpurea]|nr:AIPR family protein [Lamprocystis purpurea]